MIETLKDWIARNSSFHRPDGQPNVFLFSTPRGGSTWLMELIVSQPGFKPCNEPFNLRTRQVRAELAARGILDWPDLYSDNKKLAVHDYVRSIAAGVNGALDPFFYRNHFRILTRRICFKILHAAEDRVSWFRDSFNGRVVLLVRHPIPVSLSRKELPRLETFLESDYRRHLREPEVRLARRILEEGTALEKAVLDWCLQTAVPLRAREPDWLLLTYEQLVLDPASVIPVLARRLALPAPERMMQRLDVPSSSTHQSDERTRRALTQSPGTSRSWLVEKWRDRVTEEEEKRAMGILEAFDLDLYVRGEALPDPRFWIQAA